MLDRTNKNKIVGNLTSKSLERVSVTHKQSSDIEINKSDLIIYLGHYRNAVENKKKNGIFMTLVSVAFMWSIFFTSTFISVGEFSSNLIRTFYLILATIITFDQISKVIKKDDSKYKIENQEKMADIIEGNCKKK